MRSSPATSHAVLAAALVSLALLASMPARVHAGGYELLPGGTQAVSRAGAIAARPENAMMLEHNPAGLALLSGQQLLLNVDLPVHDMCVDPYGYYGWGVYQPGVTDFGEQLSAKDRNGVVQPSTYATTPLPRVCNSAPLFGVPHMAWAGKLSDDFALSFGFVAPTLVPGMQFGGADGTISLPNGDAVPTPTRYEVIRQELKFGFAPTLGFGYRLARWVQIGVSSQITMINATTRAVQNATSSTQPSTDSLVDLNAHDYFIPSLTLAANFTPIRELDFMVAFHWSDKFNGSGTVTYETGTYTRLAGTNARNQPIDLPRIQVGFPWTLTAAARYGGQLPDNATAKTGSSPRLGDPMDRELWDVEVDATYTFNSAAGDNKVSPGDDVTIVTRRVGMPSEYASVTKQNLSDVTLARHTLNSTVVRVGGSYSVMPRELALEAGGFYETRGLDPDYASVASFDFQRIGFGVGLMIRTGDFDLLAGYGHIFQETVEVAPPPQQAAEKYKNGDPTTGFDQRVGGTIAADGTRIGGKVLADPSAPSPADADGVAREQPPSTAPSKARLYHSINAGRYTASFNVFSLGAVYHF